MANDKTTAITCELAIKHASLDVLRNALSPLKSQGVFNYTWDASSHTLITTGSVPPSFIVSALRSADLSVIVRGITGIQDPSLFADGVVAAVAILEYHPPLFPPYPVSTSLSIDTCPRGLIRFIRGNQETILDCALAQLDAQQPCQVSIRTRGDLSNPPDSLGPIYSHESTLLSWNITADTHGNASLVVEVPRLDLSDLIGCSVSVVSVPPPHVTDQHGRKETRTACGVIARSAGVFANTKQICACSGKTLWQEAEFLDAHPGKL